MSLGDWKPLKGTKGSRYVHSVTGENISKRQYQNMQAREKGWTSYSEYQRAGRVLTLKGKQYRDLIREVAEREGLSYKDVRKLSSEFHEKRAAAVKQARLAPLTRGKRGFLGTNKRGRKRWSKNSAIAEYLIYIGRRNPNDRWAVGDTPPRQN